jgi:hypothetical protein
MIFLAIVGSRALYFDEKIAKQIIKEYLMNKLPDKIISGGCDGIDCFAADVARELNIPVEEFKPQIYKWRGKGGFMERNIKIVDNCTDLLRIYSKKTITYGSGWTKDKAIEKGKKVEEICYETWIEDKKIKEKQEKEKQKEVGKNEI